ncbi:hypothetical protein FGO68_gene3164 [Halteria grandinella]|uniref:Thioredoxin domain-containing protein n=1 Tax=Halteria grandinella TaxID=5974 RepID=A0A8J8NJJ4_HALGN|nr:hypothetical protein FGO68_gene3164 [Halteria grandinella]
MKTLIIILLQAFSVLAANIDKHPLGISLINVQEFLANTTLPFAMLLLGNEGEQRDLKREVNNWFRNIKNSIGKNGDSSVSFAHIDCQFNKKACIEMGFERFPSILMRNREGQQVIVRLDEDMMEKVERAIRSQNFSEILELDATQIYPSSNPTNSLYLLIDRLSDHMIYGAKGLFSPFDLQWSINSKIIVFSMIFIGYPTIFILSMWLLCCIKSDESKLKKD